MPKLKEVKATGERSSVEDPIDPKTVKHDIIDKKKIKKNGKIESLSYPHDTNKAYRRDTPGQQVKETAAARATAQNKLEKIRQKERHKQEKERLATAHKNEVQRLKTNEAFEELLK